MTTIHTAHSDSGAGSLYQRGYGSKESQTTPMSLRGFHLCGLDVSCDRRGGNARRLADQRVHVQ